MLVGAAGSIALAPPLLRGTSPVARWIDKRLSSPQDAIDQGAESIDLSRRLAVICGYGRVGSLIGEALSTRGFNYVVIEQNQEIVRKLRREGMVAFLGNADNLVLLERARLDRAFLLVVAIPDPLATRQIVEFARLRHPDIDIVARVHNQEEAHYLRSRGANEVMVGERELAIEMAGYALRRFGVSAMERLAIMQGLRGRD
jgi:CPA2 family monovalent cation:H+ antiporter-2